MKAFTKQSFVALAAVALLSSCSHQYATFQKSTPEHFYTKTATSVTEAPVVAEATPAEGQPVAINAAEVLTSAAEATPADAAAALKKVDALVSTKSALASNKKLTRNLARVKEMVANLNTKATNPALAATNTTSTVSSQKMSLVKRLVAKSMDKKIQGKLSPKKPMVRSMFTIGLIIGLIGLLLLLIGSGTVATLGYVALIVGIILIVVDLISGL